MDQWSTTADILGCAVARWTRIWGDPLLTGSVSMALYAVAGVVLFRVSRRTGARDRWLWRVCAILFFVQVVNTHLDAHALPGAIGHCLSQAQGWYEQRGAVKLVGIALIGVAGLCTLLLAVAAWWRSMLANTMLVAGVTIALGFTLVKGAGLSEAEEVYNQTLGPFRWADLIEYSGVVLAALAGWRRLRSLRRRMPERPAPVLGRSSGAL